MIEAFALGIHGEPALLYPFLLREEFADTPKRRRSENSEERRQIDVRHEKGCHAAADADEQIDNPGPRAPVILRLDDDGMPDAYGQERADCYNDASEIHVLPWNTALQMQRYEKNEE